MSWWLPTLMPKVVSTLFQLEFNASLNFLDFKFQIFYSTYMLLLMSGCTCNTSSLSFQQVFSRTSVYRDKYPCTQSEAIVSYNYSNSALEAPA